MVSRRLTISTLLCASLGLGSTLAGCGGSSGTAPGQDGGGGGGGSGGNGGNGGDGGTDGGGEVPLPGDYQDPLVPLDNVTAKPTPETLEVRARDDGRLFVCTNRQGLMVFDASKPESLVVQSQAIPKVDVRDRGKCQHVATDGDIAYITNRGDEDSLQPFIKAFDVSAKPAVETLSYLGDGDLFEGIATGGGLIYVALHDRGIAILEPSGGTLAKRGVLATGFANAWGVALVGTTLYVTDASFGLVVVDVSDPDAPREVGRVATPGGSPQSVEVAGSIAYVGAGAGGVYLVDVSTPAAPEVVAQADTPGSSVQVAIAGDRLFVADWNDVRVFDVTDPSLPQLIATETVPTDQYALTRVLGIGARAEPGGAAVFIGEWNVIHSYRYHADRAAPDLWAAERYIGFSRTPVGEESAAAVILRNNGTEPLVISNIEAGGAFSADRASLALAPGGAGVVEITYKARLTSKETGTLVLTSDDPDEGTFTIALTGNTSGVKVGDAAPDVSLQLLGGGSWSAADQKGKVIVLSYFATF